MDEQTSRFPVDGADGVRRSDAVRNRRRLVAAFRELFAEQGLHVPMTDVARRAGVGHATVYRHFATREALTVAAFRDGFAGCRDAIDRALAEPDPWDGFRSAIEELGDLQAADRGFTAAFLSAFPDEVELGAHRRKMLADVARVIRRAQDAGTLRGGFEVADVGVILRAVHGLATGSPERDRRATRRLVGYLLDGVRVDGRGVRGGLPPP